MHNVQFLRFLDQKMFLMQNVTTDIKLVLEDMIFMMVGEEFVCTFLYVHVLQITIQFLVKFLRYASAISTIFADTPREQYSVK